jgi:hypothetical protein
MKNHVEYCVLDADLFEELSTKNCGGVTVRYVSVDREKKNDCSSKNRRQEGS